MTRHKNPKKLSFFQTIFQSIKKIILQVQEKGAYWKTEYENIQLTYFFLSFNLFILDSVRPLLKPFPNIFNLVDSYLGFILDNPFTPYLVGKHSFFFTATLYNFIILQPKVSKVSTFVRINFLCYYLLELVYILFVSYYDLFFNRSLQLVEELVNWTASPFDPYFYGLLTICFICISCIIYVNSLKRKLTYYCYPFEFIIKNACFLLQIKPTKSR